MSASHEEFLIDLKHPSVVEEVAISKLKIDRSYQRTPSQDLVDEISMNWNDVAAEMIIVANRGSRPDDGEVEGGFFIVSGQHRVRAALKRGNAKVWSRILDLRKEEDPAAIEAEYRIIANRRVQDRAIDSFKARVRMGDDDAIKIVALLKRHKADVNYEPVADTGVNAVSALELLYRRDQGAVLNETLDVLLEVYGEITPRTASANMLKGVAWMLSSHSIEIERHRLVEKMKLLTISQMQARAGQMQAIMGKSRWMNIYIVLVEEYNGNLKPSNQLKLNFKGASKQIDKDKASHRTLR